MPEAFDRSLWAPAKVNLYLHVGPPLEDGRHPVDSLIQFANKEAADRVIVQDAAHLSLKVEGRYAGPLLSDLENNLILQASDLLRRHALRSDLAAEISLHKELPIASGVGGGSSDAAAALILLNELWGINYSQSGLMSISSTLGSDIPACIAGTPVIMRGTGEEITPTPAVELPAVLVNPNLELSTAAVYRQFDEMDLGAGFKLEPPPVARTIEEMSNALKNYRNDLEPPAKIILPIIDDVLAEISGQGAVFARMSGSGATCFGVFGTQQAAEAAALKLSEKKPEWWVRATQLSGTGG